MKYLRAIVSNVSRMTERFDKWVWMLAAVSILLYSVNTWAFYPGFMSHDSLEQLSQALGIQAYYDWHPPVMAFLWGIGIALTGHVASMLAFQLLLLWGSLFLLSWYVYKTSNSKFLSLLPLGIGLLPFVTNISAVIWKDVHMAFALLLATALTLWLPRMGKGVKIALVVGIITCLAYAVSLRYNAIFAVLPLLYLALVNFTKKRRLQLALVAGLLLCVVAINGLIALKLDVAKSNPASAVMLDDIVNSLPAATIANSKVSSDLKTSLLLTQDTCRQTGVLVHSRFRCSDHTERDIIQYSRYQELKGLWLDMFKTNLPDYIRYRVSTFGIFLTTPEKYVYVEHTAIDENHLGQTLKHPDTAQLLRGYTQAFYRDFSVLYRPYFWLIIAVALLVYVGRKSKVPHRLVVGCLALSSSFYIIGYFPLVIAGDYRYIYWPVLAVLIALLLLLTRRNSIRDSGSKPKQVQ